MYEYGPVEYRDTDFQKMDSLTYLADQQGMAIMAFVMIGDGWAVRYFKSNIKTQPKLEFCRDELDYDYRIATWVRECTIQSKAYSSFQNMIMGEIDRLKKMDLV